MSDIAQGLPEVRRFKGFFGWLLLPLFVLVATLVLGVLSLADAPGLLALLPEQKAVEAVLLIYSMATGYLIMIVAPVFLMALLFLKRRSFLLLFGLWFAVSVVHLLLGELLLWAVYRDAPFEGQTLGVAGAQAFVAFLWIRTTQTSERFKNTFVN